MEKLLEEVKNGDKEAFEKIVKMYKEQLHNIAVAKTKNEEMAKDAVQETFIALYIGAKKIKNNSSIKAWLISVLINKCNTILKKNINNKNISYEDSEFEEMQLTDDDYEIIIDNIDFKELIKFLNKDEIDILNYFYDEDYTTKEIAKIMNINDSTVRSKIKRAREKIEQKMRDW